MTELEEWRKRAIEAESRLYKIAQIPNDSIGWKEMRQTAAMQALDDLHVPEKILIYVRHSANPEIAAELCVREGDEYRVYGLNQNALLNMIRTGVGLIQEHMNNAAAENSDRG